MVTGLVSAPQLSDCEVDPLAENVQFPGPRSGTSTVSKPGSSVPESSPLIALAFKVDATGRAVVVVTLEDRRTADHVVLVVLSVTITGVDGVVTFVGFVVGVVEVVATCVGTSVVAGDVEEGGGDEAAGTRGGDDAVSVNTSTRSSSGLDHINRWALFSEKGERGMVFEG
ncbi:MAG TPA: hypothetical protein VIH73_07070 [Acidimicrobiales bacterium]